MKKEIGILTLALAPAMGFAAGTAITGNTTLTANNCSLLQDDLKIQVSTGVVGAYNCNSTATDGTYIAIAACHTGGRQTSRTSTVQTPANCSGAGANSCTGTTSSTVTGAVVPNASTLGGSMSMKFGGTCDTGGSLAAGAI
jgi:hypothetical protein